MIPKKKTTNKLIGAPLRPAVTISDDYAKTIVSEIELFYRDVLREVKAAFREGNPLHAMDATNTYEARTRLNKLNDKWASRFNDLAKTATGRMIERIKKNSTVTINMSLRTVAKDFEIDTSFSDDRMRDVIAASTQEAANLIKLIPEKFLGEVQGQVMRSITSGQGLKDLVPYMTKRYNGDIKWARHVALDQTRKAYTNITTIALRKAGAESFIWIHTGGSAHPRQEHIAMSGKEYRYDDPPVIDKRTGEKGLPSVAPFCRCIAKPVFTWSKTEGIK
jgi:SPP1 gp7 family putative phage head morphogenesis protein